MARLPRLCPKGIPQHIIQRGTNRQVCFANEADYAAYASWLAEYSTEYDVAIHAWVFMTNHVHLLATPNCDNAISKMMQSLGRCYVRYFNHCYKRTGTLWEGRFKSCVIHADHYLLNCQRYIELNPVRAAMVNAPGHYKWSSYGSNALGVKAVLWTPHDVYLELGANEVSRTEAYRNLFSNNLDEHLLKEIRDTCNQGLALGSDKFKQEVERLAGRRVSHLKRGPKPK